MGPAGALARWRRRVWIAPLLLAAWLCHLARRRRRRSLADEGAKRPLAAGREASEFRPLRERLSVVITTSASGRDPSTEMLDRVLDSLQLAAGTLACDTVIVCDGYRCAVGQGAATAPPKYRAGIVDAASAANYEIYKGALRRRERAGSDAEPALRLVELGARCGFGHAVRAALEHVKTPYVMVVQHDRPFTRAVDISRVVQAMAADRQRLKYVGLPTADTVGHAAEVLSKYDVRVEPADIDDAGLQAVPLLQWYDSTHICEVEHYRDFVLGPSSPVERGSFIEDTLGARQLADIRKSGVAAAHPRYGTFLAAGCGFEEPCVGHVGLVPSAERFRLLYGGAGAAEPSPPKKRPAVLAAGGAATPPRQEERPAGAAAGRGGGAGGAAASEVGTLEVDKGALAPEAQAEAAGRGAAQAEKPAAAAPASAAKAATQQGAPGASKAPRAAAPAPRELAGGQSKGAGAASGAAGGAAEAECPADGWQYVDPYSKVQGPFNLSEMRHWHQKGYFQPNLRMRCAPTDEFVPFCELFPKSLVAFESYPRRPTRSAT